MNRNSFIQLFLDLCIFSVGPAMFIAGIFAAFHYDLRNDANLVWIGPGIIGAAYSLNRFFTHRPSESN